MTLANMRDHGVRDGRDALALALKLKSDRRPPGGRKNIKCRCLSRMGGTVPIITVYCVGKMVGTGFGARWRRIVAVCDCMPA
jgi:hypothetical protein